MEKNKKINVLVCPSDRFGCYLHRSGNPHIMLSDMFGDDFDVEINHEPNWYNLDEFDKYDIIHVHKGLYNDMEAFWSALLHFKEKNITTILDLDDHWEVGRNHPLYASNKAMKTAEKIIKNIRLADYVTTTTEIFAEKIRKYNKNVFIYPNAIDPTVDQYLPIKEKSDRIRFGFVMGSSHEKDMQQIIGVANRLPQHLYDKIQFVLCGFDLRGTMTNLDKDGNVTGVRPIKPHESVWYRYEQIVTDNYKIVSPHYKDFLHKFLPTAQYPLVENEPYRRQWTMDVNNYAKHYRNVDVLLVPLDNNEFNSVKSELKFVEAGFTKTAVIASNFGPYTIGSNSMFKKGGVIDETGNCILIDQSKAHKDWAKYIIKLAENPELITKLQENMYNHVKDKYDIRNITVQRAEWYKSIIKK